MRAKPVVVDRFEYQYLDISTNIVFPDNLTFITGESATGKSFLYSIFNSAQTVDERIETFNYTYLSKDLYKSISSLSNKLIIIDNADILLYDKLREYIAFDFKNQYVIIGRNPSNLMLMKHQIKNICVNNNILSLY